MENENNKYNKDFNQWNIIKQQIDNKQISPEFNYNKKDVWWCSVGINIGTEMNGKNSNFERPILVFKSINKWQFFGIPLSSKIKNKNHKITYITKDKILKTGSARFSQFRVFSTKRLIRKIGSVEKTEYERIKELVIQMFT